MSRITENGYELLTEEEIIENLRTIFGDNFVGINTANESPLGQIILSLAQGIDNLQKDTQKVYNSGDLDTSEGIDLDRVSGKLIGLERQAFIPTTIQTDITSAGGFTPYTIVAGTQFSLVSDSTKLFEADQDYFINSSPQNITMLSVDFYEIDLVVGQKLIPVISNPDITDIEITNFSEGLDQQNDLNYRIDLKQVRTGNGLSGVERMAKQLLEDENISDARVFDFNNDGTLVKGQISAVVSGGSDIDIANIILENLDMGIETVGSESEVVQDYLGNNITINFDRPTPLNCTFQTTLKLKSGEQVSDDQKDQIISAFQTLCADTPIGGTLYYQDFYTLIVSITQAEAEITALTLNAVADNIVAGAKEKTTADPTIDRTNITITT